MNRDRALEELKARLISKSRLQHSIAVEAIMRKLASHLHEEIELWG